MVTPAHQGSIATNSIRSSAGLVFQRLAIADLLPSVRSCSPLSRWYQAARQPFAGGQPILQSSNNLLLERLNEAQVTPGRRRGAEEASGRCRQGDAGAQQPAHDRTGCEPHSDRFRRLCEPHPNQDSPHPNRGEPSPSRSRSNARGSRTVRPRHATQPLTLSTADQVRSRAGKARRSEPLTGPGPATTLVGAGVTP
jgi:hypothetical protein